jgi:ubiquinone/menaquinone biosynthesis C-methylase UbiE
MDPSKEPAANQDSWVQWLTHGRHGGNCRLEESIQATVEHYRDRVLDGAKLAEGMTLIDVGAGDGLIGFGALARIGRSLRVLFVDISKPLLSKMEETARNRGVLENCRFLQAPAERLDGVPDAAADVVATRSVLVYIADKLAAAREFYRALKPGGRVSLAEPIYRNESLHLVSLRQLLELRPNEASLADSRLFLQWKQAELPATVEEIAASPLTNFSERDLIAIFEQAGFEEVHLELHIDSRKSFPTPWDTFLEIRHHPGAPSLSEILASGFSLSDRAQFEAGLRPAVEAGQLTNRNSIAYLTAVKPK